MHLTSSAASSFGSNWQKICSSSFRITLANTFNLPLRENKAKDSKEEDKSTNIWNQMTCSTALYG